MPVEYFNIRLWLLCVPVLYLLVMLSSLMVTTRVVAGQRVQRIEGPPGLILSIFVSSIVFFLLMLALVAWWNRVTVGAFWFVAIGCHVPFVLSLAAGFLVHWMIFCVAFLLFFCFVLNVWSSDLRAFFNEINGRCPCCRKGKLKRPKNNRTWTCPECKRIILWKLEGKLKLKCPECGSILYGATTDMIGDVAVCAKCEAEFEIPDSR